jgi:hypothetical protein
MLIWLGRIPIITTLFSAYFFVVIWKHYQSKKQATYLLWWSLGVFCYGLGTVTESYVGLFGWNVFIFKSWYITGALLGGFPLAQGSAYLLLSKRKADISTVLWVSIIIVTSVFIALSPIDYSKVEATRLTGKVLEWKEVRMVTPFVNTYAFVMLVGGALYSAWLYYNKGPEFRNRFTGNLLIALGGLLPGIGGSFTKFGYTEVLYVTELIGILLIYAGYMRMKSDSALSLHTNQVAVSS